MYNTLNGTYGIADRWLRYGSLEKLVDSHTVTVDGKTFELSMLLNGDKVETQGCLGFFDQAQSIAIGKAISAFKSGETPEKIGLSLDGVSVATVVKARAIAVGDVVTVHSYRNGEPVVLQFMAYRVTEQYPLALAVFMELESWNSLSAAMRKIVTTPIQKRKSLKQKKAA